VPLADGIGIGRTAMAMITRKVGIMLMAAVGLLGTVGCQKEQPADTGTTTNAGAATAEKSPDATPSVAVSDPAPAETPGPVAKKIPDTAEAKVEEKPSTPATTQPRMTIPDDVNAAIVELITKWDTIQSVSAKLKTRGDRRGPEAQKQEGVGTRDLLKREDGRILSRADYKNGVTMKKPDGEVIATGQIVSKIYDGEYLWIDDQRHEGRTVTKSRPVQGQIQPIGGRLLFAGIRGLDEIKLLPDETIDGRTVHVFVGKGAGGTFTTRHYVDKETGILVKSIAEDSLANMQHSMELTDIKVNIEFEEGHFTYTPPEGVEVQDLTRRGAVRVPPPTGP